MYISGGNINSPTSFPDQVQSRARETQQITPPLCPSCYATVQLIGQLIFPQFFHAFIYFHNIINSKALFYGVMDTKMYSYFKLTMFCSPPYLLLTNIKQFVIKHYMKWLVKEFRPSLVYGPGDIRTQVDLTRIISADYSNYWPALIVHVLWELRRKKKSKMNDFQIYPELYET